jgi:hypothetical protein
VWLLGGIIVEIMNCKRFGYGVEIMCVSISDGVALKVRKTKIIISIKM